MYNALLVPISSRCCDRVSKSWLVLSYRDFHFERVALEPYNASLTLTPRFPLGFLEPPVVCRNTNGFQGRRGYNWAQTWTVSIPPVWFWNSDKPLSESFKKNSYKNTPNKVAGIFVSPARAAYLPPDATQQLEADSAVENRNNNITFSPPDRHSKQTPANVTSRVQSSWIIMLTRLRQHLFYFSYLQGSRSPRWHSHCRQSLALVVKIKWYEHVLGHRNNERGQDRRYRSVARVNGSPNDNSQKYILKGWLITVSDSKNSPYGGKFIQENSGESHSRQEIKAKNSSGSVWSKLQSLQGSLGP